MSKAGTRPPHPDRSRARILPFVVILVASLVTCKLDTLIAPIPGDPSIAFPIDLGADSQVALGATVVLQPHARNGDGSALSRPGVHIDWSADNSVIASIDSTGVLTGKAIGTVNVTALVSSPEITNPIHGTGAFKVVYKGIAIQDAASIPAIGDVRALDVRGLNAAGVAQATSIASGVVFAALDPTIADVETTTGVVTAKANGIARFTATLGAFTDTKTVTVRQVTTALTFGTQTQINIGALNKPRTVPVFATDAKNVSIAVPVTTWSTSDAAIVTVVPATGVITGVAIGSASITALSDGVSKSIPVTVTQVPAKVTKVAGDAQTAIAGSAVAIAPRLEVADSGDVTIPAVNVTFTAASGGTVTAGVVATSSSGQAAVGSWTLPVMAGPDTLTAAVGGLSTVFTATGTNGPGTRFALTATDGSAIPSQVAGTAFTVRITAQDANNNTVASYTGTPTLTSTGTLSTGGGATVAFAAGVLASKSVAISNTGSFMLTATDGTMSGVSSSFAVNPGAASRLVLTTSAVGASSGAAFTAQPVVAIRDAAGNTVTSDNSTIVTMTVSTGATVVGTATATATAGVATFTTVGVSGALGTNYTLTFTKSGLTSATQNITVTSVGSASQLVLTTSAGGAVNGAAFATQPIIAVRDGANNTVASDNTTVVTMTVSVGSTVIGTATASATAGVATFANVGISGTPGTSYTLTFSKTGLTPATQGILLTMVPAKYLVTPSSFLLDVTAQAILVTAQLQDAFGNPVSIAGRTIAWTSSGPCDCFFFDVISLNLATTSTTDANGVAMIRVHAPQLGPFQVVATDNNSLTGTSASITSVAGAAAEYVVTASSQTPAAGTGVTITAQLTDRLGHAIPTSSKAVTWSKSGAGGSFGSSGSTTNASGVATVTFTAGVTAGVTYSVTATDNTSLTGTTGNITTVPGPASQIVLTTSAAGAASGAPFSTQPVVAVRDAFGNTVTSDDGTVVTMTVSTGATVVGTATATASAGVATFTTVGITGTAGTTYTLTFTKSGLTTATQSITSTAGPAAKLVFVTVPSSLVAGQTATVQVAVADANGAIVTSTFDGITIQIASGTGSSGAKICDTSTGCIINTIGTGPVNGVATFNIGVDKVGTGYQFLATASSLTSATSSSFTVTSGLASQVLFTVQPTAAVAGQVISPAVKAAVADAYRNLVTSATNAVTMSIVSGTGVSGTPLRGTLTVNAGTGVASFTDLVIDSATAGYRLLASASGLTSASSDAFAVTVGAASQLALTSIAAGAPSGAAFTTQPVVAVRDAASNTVTSDNSTVVTMTVSTGATIVGTATATATAGVATFTTVGLSGTAGTVYTLTFSKDGLTAATQNVTVGIGSASQLVLATSPAGAPSGAPFTTQPVVAVRDAANNTVTSDNSSVVTMTVSIGATVVGTATATATAGVATFTTVGISGIAGTSYTLTFSKSGLTAATQNVTAAVGPAVGLAFTVQPSATIAGQIFSPSIKVSVIDAAANVVTSVTNSITLDIASGTGAVGASLGGTATVVAANGVATFTTVSIAKAASGYQLVATMSGINGATSAAFDINVGLASKLAFVQQPTDAGYLVEMLQAVSVAVQDQAGNTVTTATDSIVLVLSTNPGSATLDGAAARAVGGIATLPSLVLNKSASGYALDASSVTRSLSTATSSSFSVSGVGTVITISGTSILDISTGDLGTTVCDPICFSRGLYFTDGGPAQSPPPAGNLRAVSSTGGTITSLRTGVSFPQRLITYGSAIVYESGDGANGQGSISIAPSGETLVAGIKFPSGVAAQLAVDTNTATLVYVAVPDNGIGYSIRAVSLNGGASTELVALGSSNAVPCLAVFGGNVYYGANNSILKVPVTGGSPTTLTTGFNAQLGQCASTSTQIAVTATTVYWYDVGISAIRSVPSSGGPTAPTTRTSITEAFNLLSDGTFLYVVHAAFGNHELLRYSLSNFATPLQITTDINTNWLHPITLDSKSIYWVNAAGTSILKTAR